LGDTLSERGFTLIELIVVIVILGILSVTAAPKFIDISDDANKSVTSSVQGSFYSASSMLHLKWQVKGQSTSVSVNGQSILMSSTGYPDRASADHAGCLALWQNIMDSPINMVTYPGNGIATPEWSSLRFGPACVYINHGGDQFDSSVTPFFSYFPNTGTGAGFNLD
jgi:prepilin-type N-terminal cleavage/methylation domain-containing protein